MTFVKRYLNKNHYNFIESICKRIIDDKWANVVFNIVLGKHYTDPKRIYALTEGLDYFKVFHNIDFMDKLMAKMDLAICAAGTTVYELLCVGIPSIVVGTTEIHNTFSKLQPHIIWEGNLLNANGGGYEKVIDSVMDDVLMLYQNERILEKMSCEAQLLIDGLGVDRLGEEILELV